MRTNFKCVSCGKAVSVDAAHVGKQGQCPGCGHLQTIPPPTNDSPSTPPPIVTETSVTEQLSERAHQARLYLMSHLRWAVVFIVILLVSLLGILAPPSTFTLPKIPNEVVEVLSVLMGLAVIFTPPLLFYLLLYILSVHKIRRLRQIIYFNIWLGPLAYVAFSLLVTLPSNPLLAVLSGLSLAIPSLLWFHLGRWPARWFTPYILALFVWRITCVRCKETHSVRSLWHCGCGYKDHRDDRNIILFSCPQCQSYAGHLDCPRCDATILL